jgi:sugar phosphate isomerase/epimerase
MDARTEFDPMKIGLYSITFQGLWYRGPALSLEDVIRAARRLGYEGVEFDGKHPHANPLSLPESRCHELRALADGEGIEIYAVAANNDFSSPVPEQREAQLVYLTELIRATARLRVPVLRVFAAWPGVTIENGLARYDIARRLWAQAHEGVTTQDTWARCRDGLVFAARVAREEGVVLALQNHPPVIDTHSDMLRMIGEVNSSALMACLDAPLVAKYEKTSMREAVAATGPLQVLSHFGGEYERADDGSVRVPERFYEDFVAALAESGYLGYLGYELCHPLPEAAGLDFAEQNARLAAEHMRALLHRTASSR